MHGGFRDFIEGDTPDAAILQAKRLLEVPGDGFAFAVGVRRQVDHIRAGSMLLQQGEDILAILQIAIGWNPPCLDVDAESAAGQMRMCPLLATTS